MIVLTRFNKNIQTHISELLLYFVVTTLLPYYKVAKMLFKRNSFAYRLFLFLNTLWLGFIVYATMFCLVKLLVRHQ